MSTSPVSSKLRLSGMSSGMDTDSIIKSLMAIEKLKVDRVVKQKTLLEWKKDAHKEINSIISTFRSENLSALSSTNLYSSSAFNSFKVTMDAASSNVSLSTTAEAMTGAMTINSISQLASAATVSSSAKLSSGTKLDKAAALSSLTLATGLVFGGDNSDTIAFSINNVAFTFKSTDTLKTMISTVNNSEAGVVMSYSELTDKLQIKASATGAASSVNIVNTTGNAFGAASAFGIEQANVQAGTDAMLTINGTPYTNSSNNFTVDGINYKLKFTSASAINFSVERDVDSVVDRIKNFVTQYNKLVASLQDKLKEEPDSDYGPLSATEKEAMSETEITAWESKAHAGLLHNDRNMANLLGKMRGLLYQTVTGVGLSLSDIGLKTGTYADGGKISLNETQLKSALEKNPDQVMDLFTKNSDTSTSTEMGFLPNLVKSFGNYTGTYSLTQADQEIGKVASRISDLESKLQDKENALYKKYSAMETALSKMSSQSSWLSQQFPSN